MTKDCYGTCPKCGEIGWCHYKGKARIFKSGPGTGTYKVSLFKCGNCGKKFGFELEDSMPEPKLNKEEDDSEDWQLVCELLNSYPTIDAGYPNDPVTRAYIIAKKHCNISEPKLNEEEDNDWEEITEILAEVFEDLNMPHVDDVDIVAAMRGLERALDITAKHC